MLLYMFIVIYIVVGVVTYGLEFAYWTSVDKYTKENYYDVMKVSFVIGLLWPITLCGNLIIREVNSTLIDRYRTTGIKFK